MNLLRFSVSLSEVSVIVRVLVFFLAVNTNLYVVVL
jgi:hypothetical protein